MKIWIIIVSIISCILIFGCKKSEINYYEPFQNKLVVYGVIDSRSNLQLIRIQSNTARAGEPDENKKLKNLNVKVTLNNTQTYNLRDTVIEGIENYSVYYHPDFKFKTGSFLLMVTSDDYPSCWATANVPEKQKMSLEYKADKNVITIPFNLTTKGYFYNTYLYYALTQGAQKTIKKIEIPIQILTENGKKIPVYPDKIEEEVSKAGEISIPYSNIDYAIEKLRAEYGTDNISLGSCYLYFHSLDWNLYNYYHSINGFKDPFSIRLDQPYWTNVSGGYGIFGAVRSDSIEIIVGQ
jgi:hypothetical protein